MSEVEPPLRPPTYAQPIGGEDCFVEPATMLDELAGLLSIGLDIDRSWIVGNWNVLVASVGERAAGQPLSVDFLVSRNGSERDAALNLSVHPSGWIDARVSVGSDSRHFFIERIYEEFEIWPPGSPCAATDSGRMGKRCGWVQLQAQHWPDLTFLAEGNFSPIHPASDLPLRT